MKKRILIVEDNEKNLKLFSIITKSMGYVTLTAPDGEEAVKVAKESSPDLILMDIQMPKMDGISALKILQSSEDTRHIPVVALTSYAMKGDRERLVACGFSDYIAKPIERKAFVEIVERALK